MTTALATTEAPKVTPEQMELVKKTVANGATADELKLYLYDCARQGVHPLDKLIHFTKRSNKYTPITSIDFMRIRAADTGEYAGSDDATFTPGFSNTTEDFVQGKPSDRPDSATVTVWRFVQGQRCAFTATARWSEYKPDANDFMWKKMPHTMLAKCAEALALRKGFPKQLAGLYAKEEMDQSGPVTNGEQPAGDASWKASAAEKKARGPLPEGAIYIDKLMPKTKGNFQWVEMTAGDAEKEYVVNVSGPQLIDLTYQLAQDNVPVVMSTHKTSKGNTAVDRIDRWKAEPDPAPAETLPLVELHASDIPF